ncbi:rhodanese-like domain-containing protein [Baaleninema simplex]|uniref:rhodanese-like domain-containing protein n=1 Tax=Baaleninema simplex TaxID=2862350 RepID=UPI000347D488|nr:rhodanese-like domain-containing protein [Baaleninema simplex]
MAFTQSNLPTPPPFQSQATADELQSRLNWGEPALTIIDVRDREAFNKESIRGAVPLPMSELVSEARANFETTRDIYVYGNDDDETRLAATTLREAGFERVAELKSGLNGWKAIAAPVES